MKNFLAIAAVLAGCADTPRGSIDVQVYSKRQGSGTVADALVVFSDTDGTSRTARTGGAGQASGEIEVGGTVWVLEDSPPDQSPGPIITAYVDVEPGSTITVGPAPRDNHAVKATMTIAGTPPTGTESIVAVSNCGGAIGPGMARFDDRCTTTADVVLLATHLIGGVSGTVLVSYQYLPALPITDGGTITVDPNGWKSPDDVTLTFTNGGTPVDYYVGNTIHIPYGAGTSKRLPVFGRLRVGGSTPTGSFELVLPATAIGAPIDLSRVLAPAATAERATNGDVTWSAADDGRTANALVTINSWIQPIANYDLTLRVEIYSPPATNGTITYPKLPGALSKYQPGSDFQVDKRGYLIRSEVPGIDPRRVADQLNLHQGGGVIFEDLAPTTTWSVATTPLL